MPLTQTLAELREQARQYADMESSGFISDAEANRYVNLGLAQLWHLLVSTDIDRYASSTEVVSSPGSFEYPLPDDFAQLRAVELLDRSGAETGYRLLRYSIGEGHSDGSFPTLGDGAGLRYTLYGQGVDGAGTRLRFSANPCGRAFRIWYVQSPPRLTADGDSFDGVAGWEEWAVLWAAEQMLAKEESDPSSLIRRRAEMTSRIQAVASRRDAGQAPQIVRRRRRGGRQRAGLARG